MRLLNKLSTGAYRFKATPVEAVRLGIAIDKGSKMKCIASGERLGCGSHGIKEFVNHLVFCE